MNDLLDHVIAAHGGQERWSQIKGLRVDLTLHGPFWALRGFSEKPLDERVTIDTRRELLRFSPWGRPGQDFVLRAEDDAVELRAAADDSLLQTRSGIRSTYQGYDLTSPWEPLQVGYFIGYATWCYLTTPFLLAAPGVSSYEGEPWTKSGEVWRRLHVEFPPSVTTHTARQTFYFGDDGLLRRLDYTVDVNLGVAVAHYVSDYRTLGGDPGAHPAARSPSQRRQHRQ